MNAPSIQEFLDKATNIGFEEHLRSTVAQTFKNLLTGTLKVVANLLPHQRQEVMDMMPVPVVFSVPEKAALQPHPVLAAVRASIRSVVVDGLMAGSAVDTLVCGATYRDISSTLTNDHWSFSIYGSELKDNDRNMVPMLSKIGKAIEKTAKYFDMDEFGFDLTTDETIRMYSSIYGIGDRVGEKLEYSGRKFERLVYLDSGYNMGWEDYETVFTNTGANTAVVFGIYPSELVDNKCPKDKNYTVTISDDGKRARITDVDGFANGYEHDLYKWSALLRKPAHECKGFNLVSEITSRVGPYCVFTITRTMAGGPICRDITLFKQPYVEVMDLRHLSEAYIKREDARLDVLNPDVVPTFLVPASEYQQVYTYIASLDRKTPDLEVVTSFVRKRSGGAALIDRTLTKAWQSEESLHSALCAAVIVKVRLDQRALDDGMGKVTSMQMSNFWSMVKSVVNTVAIPFDAIVNWFESKPGAIEEIVKVRNPVLSQSMVLREWSKAKPNTHRVTYKKKAVPIVPPEEEEVCDMCQTFPWLRKEDERDEQYWRCPGASKAEVKHTFRMSADEVEAFKVKACSPDNETPPQLAKVMLAAKEKLPVSGFSFTTTVRNIQGAFGTGKSFQVKKVVTADDYVIAPFGKLRKDYDKDMSGQKINFKTNHRAISDMQACKNLYVDEFGSMAYEFLAIAAYLGQAEYVYLVGDLKQTKVMASEGTLISLRVPCKFGHFLVKNFRNTKGTIDWANAKFGYGLECSSKTPDGPAWVFEDECELTPDELANCLKVSPDRITVEIDEAENTVREMQGQTEDRIRLMISPASMATFAVGCIRLVAMTRTREPTIICLTADADKAEVLALLDRVESLPEKVTKATNKAQDYASATRLFQVIKEITADRVTIEAKRPLESVVVDDEPEVVEPPLPSNLVSPVRNLTKIPIRKVLLPKQKRFEVPKVNVRRGWMMNRKHLDKPINSRYINEHPANSSAAIAKRLARARPRKSIDSVLDQWCFERNLPTLSIPLSDAYGIVDTAPAQAMREAAISEIKVKEDTAGFVDVLTRFLPSVRTRKAQSTVSLTVGDAATLFRSAKESVSAAADMDPNVAHMGEALNRITRMPGTVFKATITGDMTTITNSKGNPRKMVKVNKIGTGNALSYDNGHPTQELHTAAARYAVPHKAYVLDEPGKRLAAEIALNGFNDCIDKDLLRTEWNDGHAEEILAGFVYKVRSAGYDTTWTQAAEPFDPTIRFHPKAQQKVKEMTLSLESTFKAPQGISATSKEFNTAMGAACRFIGSIIQKSLKPEFTWNNGMTPQEACRRYTAAAIKVPVDDNVTLDVVEMDKEQNEFTHLINRCFDELLGVSRDFLDLYYGLYSRYTMIGSQFKASLSWVKPSGAPWTLKGNSFLEFLISSYIIVGDGPKAVFFQGDDLNRTQANMHIEVNRKAQIERYCAFQMSIVFSKESAFCGFTYARGMLVPNIRRKLNKIIAAPIRSREHFYQYQAGIRDWVKDLRANDQLSTIVKVNAQQLCGSEEMVDSWLDAIDSISHCKWEQWLAFSNVVDLNINYLREDGQLQTVW